MCGAVWKHLVATEPPCGQKSERAKRTQCVGSTGSCCLTSGCAAIGGATCIAVETHHTRQTAMVSAGKALAVPQISRYGAFARHPLAVLEACHWGLRGAHHIAPPASFAAYAASAAFDGAAAFPLPGLPVAESDALSQALA